ncbi:MAG: hypothetical protein QOF09_4800 [Alphaproteobacteria bacterium]|jgi:tripartite-type tricarboxylate transporter receptor subunit TctC|nr:hypothetical protein [Alphaproteobacteria bacterium]
MKCRLSRWFFGIVALVLMLPQQTIGQTLNTPYPSKPIRIVVNFAAGGGVDLVARIVAAGLSEELGQTTVVENRPGAGGSIGAEYVSKSEADGYTFLVTNGGALHTNPHLAKSTFDPLTSLTPVTDIARIPNLLVVRKSLPVNNVAEFIAYLRANPGKATFGSQGIGTTSHISGEMLNSMLGTEVVHVPYRGTSTVYPDLIGGRIDCLFDSGTGLGYVRDGSLKLLATTSAIRLSLFPDTPTMNETVAPGFIIDSTHSIQAPAGTPNEIVTIANRAIVKYLRKLEIEQRVRSMGLEVAAGTPEESAAGIRNEYNRIGEVVRKLGLSSN